MLIEPLLAAGSKRGSCLPSGCCDCSLSPFGRAQQEIKRAKAAAADYITLTSVAETARMTTGVTYGYGMTMDTILFAVATTDAAGASDPCSFASGVVTLSAGASTTVTVLVIGV